MFEILKPYVGETVTLVIAGLIAWFPNRKRNDVDVKKGIVDLYQDSLTDLKARYEEKYQDLKASYEIRFEDLKKSFDGKMNDFASEVEELKKSLNDWKKKYFNLKRDFDNYKKDHP